LGQSAEAAEATEPAGTTGTATTEQVAKSRRHAAAAAHLLHHVLHRLELLDEAIHGVDGVARAGGDAAAPRQVDHVGALPFARRHRLDHRLEALEVFVVEVDVFEHRADAGQHAEHLLQRAELANHV